MSVQDQIVASATAAGVDPNLALAVAQRESGFNQNAVGASGEIGIFQLMPATAAGLGVDPTTVDGNIAGGVRYLAQMLALFGGDPFKALAGYNAGPGRVSQAIAQSGDNWFNAIPASTQDYVASIMGQVPGTTVTPAAPTTLGIPTTAAGSLQPLLIGAALIAGLIFVHGVVANPLIERRLVLTDIFGDCDADDSYED